MVASGAKNAVFWAVMVATAVLLWAAVRSSSRTEKSTKQISLTEFVGELDRDNVRDVTIEPGQSSVVLKVTGFAKHGDAQFNTTIPTSYADVYRRLLEGSLARAKGRSDASNRAGDGKGTGVAQ